MQCTGRPTQGVITDLSFCWLKRSMFLCTHLFLKCSFTASKYCFPLNSVFLPFGDWLVFRFVWFRNLVSASQDGKLIVWDSYTTNKVRQFSNFGEEIHLQLLSGDGVVNNVWSQFCDCQGSFAVARPVVLIAV